MGINVTLSFQSLGFEIFTYFHFTRRLYHSYGNCQNNPVTGQGVYTELSVPLISWSMSVASQVGYNLLMLSELAAKNFSCSCIL
jgi:hypothetical protein